MRKHTFQATVTKSSKTSLLLIFGTTTKPIFYDHSIGWSLPIYGQFIAIRSQVSDVDFTPVRRSSVFYSHFGQIISGHK